MDVVLQELKRDDEIALQAQVKKAASRVARCRPSSRSFHSSQLQCCAPSVFPAAESAVSYMQERRLRVQTQQRVAGNSPVMQLSPLLGLRVDRDLHRLDSEVLSVRKEALSSLHEFFAPSTVTRLQALRCDEHQAFLSQVHLPLFKLFADVSEICRDMAIHLTSILFSSVQDIPSSVLDHFFAVVRVRQPPCACYDPTAQLFVQDPQAYEAYQRGKAIVPGQGTVTQWACVESSEEVRLRICRLLHQLVYLALERGSESGLRPYFHDLVLFFHGFSLDPFAVLQIEACTAMSTLARSFAFELGMKLYAVGLVRAILPLLHHRLSKVRIAAIAAIQDLVKVPDRGKRKGAGTDAIVELVGFRAENVLPISVFYRADVSFNYLAQLSQDAHPMVRKSLVNMLAEWLTQLPDRYDHETRLLPFLLNGLNDPVQENQVHALKALAKCADLYVRDNEEEIRAYQLLDAPINYTAHLAPALPLPFQERPNLATRLYVRTNTRRILPALLEELSHWMASARQLSAKLLRALIIFYENSFKDDLPILLPALLKALAFAHEVGEDQGEFAATLTHCAELIGWFCFNATSSSIATPPLDPSVFLPEETTISSSTNSTRRRLARTTLLAHFRALGGKIAMFDQHQDENEPERPGQQNQHQHQQQNHHQPPPVGETGPWVWYMEMPVVSRVYLTASVLTTAACALDLVSPFNLYFNLSLVRQGQVWRLFTNFMYFGNFSLDFLFHMYFLVRYCRLLEEGTFRGRTADFIFMILFGATMITCIAPFIRPSIPFLGSSLTFMMVYVWGRQNEHVRLTFLNLFPFTAPYLPWVLLTFSMVLGNPATIDVIGIIVGHTYYFLEFVFPVVAEARGWPVRRLFHTPAMLHYFCGTYHHEEAPGAVRVDFAPAHANAAAPPPPPAAAGAGAGAGGGGAGGGQHLHED
ncbi:hypothetical protein VYU27_003685 [Nannochloropsis oceanica]